MDTVGSRIKSRSLLAILEWVVAGVITVMAALIHLHRLLWAGPLWRDEVAALTLARMPWAELLQYFPHEAFPLLFPITVRSYTNVAGTSDFALRLFGFAVGITCIAMLWVSARLLGQRAPLLSLILVGFNPVFFVWGDSIRGYGIAAAMIMLTFGLAGRTILKPGWIIWVCMIIAALLSAHFLVANTTLLFAILVAAAVALFRNKRPRDSIAVLAIGFFVLLSMLPYAPAYLHARNWDSVIRLNLGLRWFVIRLLSALANPNWAMLYLWAGTAITLCAGLLVTRRRHEKSGGIATYAALAVILAAVVYGSLLHILGYATQAWYYFPLFALLAVALETGIQSLTAHARWLHYVRLGLAIISIFAIGIPAFAFSRVRVTNLDLVAQELSKRAGPNDLILLIPWQIGISFAPKYHGSTPWQTVPPIDDLRIHRYDLLQRQMSDPPIQALLDRVEQTLKSGYHVWLIGDPIVQVQGANSNPAPVFRLPNSAEAEYSQLWTSRLTPFLFRHIADVHEIHLTTPLKISSLENADVLEVYGWR
jgi:hypothetical protein